jgi:hypothetical protein
MNRGDQISVATPAVHVSRVLGKQLLQAATQYQIICRLHHQKKCCCEQQLTSFTFYWYHSHMLLLLLPKQRGHLHHSSNATATTPRAPTHACVI